MKIEAIKDGNGNIIITENSFEMLLSCLDNSYNIECRKILNQKYIIDTVEDGYFLIKRYEHQDKITPWSGNDVGLVYELFKDTLIESLQSVFCGYEEVKMINETL